MTLSSTSDEEPEVILSQYVIYDHPREFPVGFVVREWQLIRGREHPVPVTPARTAGTLAGARRLVPQGLMRISRAPGDDMSIVETWT